MKKIKIYTNEVLLDALFCMQKVNNRRSVTRSELDRFQEYIAKRCLEEGIEAEFIYDGTERTTRLRELVDTIMVDGMMVYRINPGVQSYKLIGTIYLSELNWLSYEYLKMHYEKGELVSSIDEALSDDPKISEETLEALKQSCIPGVNSWEFFKSCTDFTAESEIFCPEFQMVDKRHQLNAYYQLIQLERQRRSAEDVLNAIHRNSNVEEIDIEEVFDKYPNITREEFFSKMAR